MSETTYGGEGSIREKMRASGEAGDVLAANRQAWEAFESVVGNDDPGAWELTEMEHAVTGLGKIEWHATFVRDDSPTPPDVKLTDASKIVAPPPASMEEALRQEREVGS